MIWLKPIFYHQELLHMPPKVYDGSNVLVRNSTRQQLLQIKNIILMLNYVTTLNQNNN
jgi:hypothetical protein